MRYGITSVFSWYEGLSAIYGGAIYALTSYGYINTNYNHFIKNTAKLDGGAIYARNTILLHGKSGIAVFLRNGHFE